MAFSMLRTFKKQGELDAVIRAFETKLAYERTEWARQLRELIEDAVQYKANLATV